MKEENIKIGIFGIGLDTYWKQYPGLETRLRSYLDTVTKQIEGEGIRVISAGMVDNIEKAHAAASLFKQNEVSAIFLYITTYALSGTVLQVIQHAKVPVVILNLQPENAIDYLWFNNLKDRTAMTGEWLANCQACSVPEIANVFNRCNIPFHQVSGTLHDADAWKEIYEWVQAILVAQQMRNNRMGFLGHYYCGMLDVYSDITLQSGLFGTHIQQLEMCDLKTLHDKVTVFEMQEKRKVIDASFDVSIDCTNEELERAAKTAVALDKMMDKHNLGSLCYYYEGAPGNEYENIITSVIVGNSLLTARHIPVAGEAEVKNVQAMKILDLFGAGGSFTEFYLMDFNEDVLLMGHDGPGHIAIAEGKPLLKPLNEYHGKPGKGLSVEMKVKKGPVTLLAIAEQKGGTLKLLVAEAQSIAGPVLQIGNTNSRYKFSMPVKQFINQWCSHGPSHHCAIGIGHIASKIHKLGALLNIDVVKIG